jgi:molecular chaperone GrpE
MNETMHESPQRPKQVKVRVIDEEKLPTTIDLEEEVHGATQAAMRRTAAAETPDWQERYLRLAADLDNTKKRLAQKYQHQAKQEKERLLSDFLEVADNLERALANADPAKPEALIGGVEAIQRQFRQTLAKHGVKPFEAQGKPFDPECHEAISVLHRPDLPPDSVVHIIQPGYAIGDSVLRPARVVVNKDR